MPTTLPVRRLFPACTVALTAGLLGVSSAGFCAGPPLRVAGTAFELKLEDGTVLHGAELEGTVVHLVLGGNRAVPVRLAAIRRDPDDRAILQHDFQIRNPDGQWQPFCTGFPLALPAGHPGRNGDITLVCSSGAVGKCVRFGYKPWKEELLPYHAACVHAVRADYCGDGTAHTRDGVLIDIYDRLGIQKPSTLGDGGYAFEAGYARDGAVCVASTRWPATISVQRLRKDCPRLPATPCTERSARDRGALVFTRTPSRPPAED